MVRIPTVRRIPACGAMIRARGRAPLGTSCTKPRLGCRHRDELDTGRNTMPTFKAPHRSPIQAAGEARQVARLRELDARRLGEPPTQPASPGNRAMHGRSARTRAGLRCSRIGVTAARQPSGKPADLIAWMTYRRRAMPGASLRDRGPSASTIAQAQSACGPPQSAPSSTRQKLRNGIRWLHEHAIDLPRTASLDEFPPKRASSTFRWPGSSAYTPPALEATLPQGVIPALSTPRRAWQRSGLSGSAAHATAQGNAGLPPMRQWVQA